MPRFAADTAVPVERSRAEIEQCLIKYGASAFQTGWEANKALVAFKMKELLIRFELPLPERTDAKFRWKLVRGSKKARTDNQIEAAWQQEIRQRWRALLLVVRAKLEAVECKISTLEKEFLAFIVLPDDITLGDWIVRNALPQIRSGSQAPLRMLTGPRAGDPPIDAEFTTAKPEGS